MNKLLLSFLLILSVLIGCNTSPQKKSALSHSELMAPASRIEKNGWILIHVEGKPEVIGYQHGYLLAGEIIDLRGAMAVENEKITGKNWNFYRDEAYRMFWPKIPEEYQKELIGISAGVNAKLGEGKIDTKDLVAINSFLEMASYYVPWLNEEKNPSPPEHCSAFAATGSWTGNHWHPGSDNPRQTQGSFVKAARRPELVLDLLSILRQT